MRRANLQKDDQNKTAWVLNANDRLFQAWATVEMRDNQGQIIAIEKFEEIMPFLIDRAVPIHLEHTNQAVGVVKNYEFSTNPKFNKKGLLITGKIYSHFPKDHEAWIGVQNGDLAMVSIGGQSGQLQDGSTQWVAMCEVALTRKGANNGSTIEAVSMAKSDLKKDAPTWVEDTIMEAYQKFKDEKKTLAYVLRQDSIQEAIVDGYTNQKEIETLVRQEAGMSKGDKEGGKMEKDNYSLGNIVEADTIQTEAAARDENPVIGRIVKKTPEALVIKSNKTGALYYVSPEYVTKVLQKSEMAKDECFVCGKKTPGNICPECEKKKVGEMEKVEYGGDKPTRAYDPAKASTDAKKTDGGSVEETKKPEMKKEFRDPSPKEESKWASLGGDGQIKALKECGEGDSQAGMSLKEIGGSTADCLISVMGGMKKADAPVPPAPAPEQKAPPVAEKAEAPKEGQPPAPEAPPVPTTPEAPVAPAAPEAPAKPEAQDFTKAIEGITATLAKQGESIAKIMEKLSIAEDVKQTAPAEDKKEEAPKEPPKEEAKTESKEPEKPAAGAPEAKPEEKPEKKKEDMGKAAVTDMKKSVEDNIPTPRPPVQDIAFDPVKHEKQAAGKIPTVKDIMNGAKLDTLEFVKGGFGALQS